MNDCDFKSRVDFVSDEILEMIIDGGFQVGDKLPNELEIAKDLNVGRSTVREAIKKLESQNILVIKQGAGTFISDKKGLMEDPMGFRFFRDKNKLVRDIIEVRMMIEPTIAEMAALNSDREDIEQIKYFCKKVEEDILKNRSHTKNDILFHTAIAKSSKNKVISNLIPIINKSIEMSIDITDNKLVSTTIECHKEILEAISEHNPIAAKDAMTLHIIYNRKYISEKLSKIRKSKEEIDSILNERRNKLKPFIPKFKKGALAVYSSLATGSMKGAYMEIE